MGTTATPATVSHTKEQILPAKLEGTWLKFFPGDQIPRPFVLAEPMDSLNFQMEGHDLHAIEVGHSDTNDTTILHVPSIHLVVAGDVVYGDVHQFFVEAEWLRAIDTIESLKPHMVVAGHKRASTVDGVFNLRSTREYILAFEEATKTTSSWEEQWERMKTLYPGRINPHAIIAGAVAAFKTDLDK
ncbi:hypothetical protein VE03_08382 [Pseudogymnoascus sp. 23342-1-I1]|nr:hypothetical protein VE03_08382 [Pseudogymnoascus sp. 23342-1-I1]